MHIKSVKIQNIRSFPSLEWELQATNLNGWHVIIGDNGAGKSTFLRSIALALCGPKEIQGLRERWETWRRIGSEESNSKIELQLSYSEDWDKGSGRKRKEENDFIGRGLQFNDTLEGEIAAIPLLFDVLRGVSMRDGWFSASYGPFRRFTGGDVEKKSVFYTHSVLGRHLSVFGENVALTESLEWLSQLRFEELDNNLQSGGLLRRIQAFINQPDFLPHGVRFEEVNSKAVVFRNPEGMDIDVTRLSDGFRSVLSMTFELIRQMAACYETYELFEDAGDGSIVVKAPGVVLIDEVDAHLHPTWQRKIGFWFTRHFPEIQFIVTTHSPLVCQAAEKGSIFRLPAPGSNQTDSGFVTGPQRERLIHGDVLDAYGTELFGREVDRSDVAKEKLEELALLNQKAAQNLLSSDDAARQTELKQAFSAHIQSPF